MVRSHELQSLANLCNAKILSFSALPDLTPSTSITLFPFCSQGGRSPRVLTGSVDTRIELQTSLTFFLQLVFFVRWRTSAVAICFLGFAYSIKKEFPMAMVLSYVALVTTVESSASANVASTGVVLIFPVIAHPVYL